MVNLCFVIVLFVLFVTDIIAFIIITFFKYVILRPFNIFMRKTEYVTYVNLAYNDDYSINLVF